MKNTGKIFSCICQFLLMGLVGWVIPIDKLKNDQQGQKEPIVQPAPDTNIKDGQAETLSNKVYIPKISGTPVVEAEASTKNRHCPKYHVEVTAVIESNEPMTYTLSAADGTEYTSENGVFDGVPATPGESYQLTVKGKNGGTASATIAGFKFNKMSKNEFEKQLNADHMSSSFNEYVDTNRITFDSEQGSLSYTALRDRKNGDGYKIIVEDGSVKYDKLGRINHCKVKFE